MKTVTIHDAKTNLSKYIAEVKNGEKIYIGGFGKAEVQLVKIATTNKKAAKRSFKAGKGLIRPADDAFSETTDAAIANLLLGD